MTHGEFVYPAYAIGAGAVLAMVIRAYAAMRRAEAAAAALRERGR